MTPQEETRVKISRRNLALAESGQYHLASLTCIFFRFYAETGTNSKKYVVCLINIDSDTSGRRRLALHGYSGSKRTARRKRCYAERRDRLMIPVALPKPAMHEDELVIIGDTRVKGSRGYPWILDVVMDDLDPLDRASKVETRTSVSGWPGSNAHNSHRSKTVAGNSPCPGRPTDLETRA